MLKVRLVLVSLLSLLVPLLVVGASPSGAAVADDAARGVKQVGTLGWSADALAAPAEVTWTATFKPARPGRAVVFSEKRGTKLVRVATVRQDARGRAVYRTTYTKSGDRRMQAVAKAGQGLGARSTPVVTSTLE